MNPKLFVIKKITKTLVEIFTTSRSSNHRGQVCLKYNILYKQINSGESVSPYLPEGR